MPTLTGNAGIQFNISEVNTSIPTGTVNQVHTIGTTVSDVTIGTTDVAISLYGYVGANSYQLNLKNVNNISGTGTGIDIRVDRNQLVSFSNVRVFAIENLSTSNTITIAKGATSNYLAATESIVLQPMQAFSYVYGNINTVGATSSVISVVGNAGSTYHKIYVLGN